MVRDYGVQTMRVPPWMQGCDMDDICRMGDMYDMYDICRRPLCITLPAPGVLGGHTFSFFATARTYSAILCLLASLGLITFATSSVFAVSTPSAQHA